MSVEDETLHPGERHRGRLLKSSQNLADRSRL